MKSTEEIIWNIITDSAKKKFDFGSLEDEYPLDADMLIFTIITEFAVGTPDNVIIAKLTSELLLLGYQWKEVDEFVREKRQLFNLEIYLTQLAGDMLQDGIEPEAVLHSISQLV